MMKQGKTRREFLQLRSNLVNSEETFSLEKQKNRNFEFKKRSWSRDEDGREGY